MTNYIIDSYGISVELSMHDPIAIPENEKPESFYIRRRNQEINISWKKECDRAQALVKYAEKCGGKVKRIASNSSKTTFTFEFDNLDNLLNFSKSLRSNIEI